MHKKNGTRDANNTKQRMITMGSIRAQIVKKDGNKEAFTFEERYHSRTRRKIKQEARMEEPQERRKPAEAEKEKEMIAVVRTVKAEAETDTRETAPHDQESDANIAAAKKRSQ